ncbi:hypothetical protein LguiB_009032 [Lonicera macranthoides]
MSFATDRVFNKPSDAFIHIHQLNAISYHNGFRNPPPIMHPIVAHILLGYTPNTTHSSRELLWFIGLEKTTKLVCIV